MKREFICFDQAQKMQKSNNSPTFSSFVRTIDIISDMSFLISSATVFLNRLYLLLRLFRIFVLGTAFNDVLGGLIEGTVIKR